MDRQIQTTNLFFTILLSFMLPMPATLTTTQGEAIAPNSGGSGHASAGGSGNIPALKKLAPTTLARDSQHCQPVVNALGALEDRFKTRFGETYYQQVLSLLPLHVTTEDRMRELYASNEMNGIIKQGIIAIATEYGISPIPLEVGWGMLFTPPSKFGHVATSIVSAFLTGVTSKATTLFLYLSPNVAVFSQPTALIFHAQRPRQCRLTRLLAKTARHTRVLCSATGSKLTHRTGCGQVHG